MESQPGMRITPQLVLGIAIAVVGLLFTLDNLHVLRAREFLRYWPVVLVAIGIVNIMQARTGAGTIGGTIWIVAGAVLLGNRLGVLDIHVWSLWPLVLVVVGGRIVWQAVVSNASAERGLDDRSMVSAIAVMGGFDRRITSDQFRGGELTAFMGGGKLDLREAVPAGGRAVVNVFAMMGGFEIIVPETWNVSVEVTHVMGGVEDKTRGSSNPAAPRLVLRGFTMMGGMDIKN
jgi:predicted membrane protein